MQGITKFLGEKLRLKVNEQKSAVGRPWEENILGFTYTRQKQPRRRIAPSALKRVKERIRQVTSRKRGSHLEDIVEELKIYMRGWLGYFGFCETPSVLNLLQQWLRRKLRCLIWKRWKTIEHDLSV